MKSPTLDEQAESELAPVHPTEGGGRQAAITALLLVVGMVLLAIFRPQLAGTIGVLAAIVLMIMLHELGHFVMAKRAGMKVTEYFLGFGPRLWSFRKGETEYGVKAIPAGGYVRIIGMSNLDVVEPEDEDRTYRSKPYHDRLGVAVAGSTMHFIIAFFLLLAVYALVGIPAARPIIQQIVPDSPAQHSDFRVGDRIVAVNGVAVKNWDDIPNYIQSHGESELTFTVIHKGSTQRTDVALTPRAETVDGKQIPRVGIGPEQYLQTKSLPSAVATTATDMPKFMWETVKALGGLFSPHGIENYGHLLQGHGGNQNNRLLSPVGATKVAAQAVNDGWGAVLMFLFAINVFVGIFNMVPLLPLDGGHVAIATYEKIASSIKRRRVQVDVQKLMPITAAVLFVLVILGLSALYLDIVRPVSSP